MLYICIAKRRTPETRGVLLFFELKISDFYLRDRNFYLRDKFFFGLGTIFFGIGRCAQQLFRNFFGREIIKDIKVFRAKKVGF